MPMTSIAEGLRAVGHEVVFYGASRARQFVEDRGFIFHSLNPQLDADIDHMFSDAEGTGRQWDGSDVVAMLERFFVDTLPGQVDDIRRIHEDWGIDAILCEFAMWGPRVIASELLDIPVCLVELPVSTIPGPDVGIPGLDLPRPSTAFHKLAYNLVKIGFGLKVKRVRQRLTEVRRSYGLAPLPAPVAELASELPLVLIQSCPEFDYRRSDLPANHRYVGPCTRYPEPTESLDWLDNLPNDRPKIHLSEGTMYIGDPLILRTAVEAFKDGSMTVILTTGNHRRPADLGLVDLPPNFIVRQWIPHSHLLPRMDAVVTHGGGGSVMATLSMGVPSVVVPLMWDQPENARRAEFTGSAYRLPAKKCTAARLRSAVEEVIKNPSYRRNAQRMAVILSGYGGATQAAKIFEQEVLKPTPVTA